MTELRGVGRHAGRSCRLAVLAILVTGCGLAPPTSGGHASPEAPIAGASATHAPAPGPTDVPTAQPPVDPAFRASVEAACAADPRIGDARLVLVDPGPTGEAVLLLESETRSVIAEATRGGDGSAVCTPLAGGSRPEVSGGDLTVTDWVQNGEGWIVAGVVSPGVHAVVADLDTGARVGASVGDNRFLAHWTRGNGLAIAALDADGRTMAQVAGDAGP